MQFFLAQNIKEAIILMRNARRVYDRYGAFGLVVQGVNHEVLLTPYPFTQRAEIQTQFQRLLALTPKEQPFQGIPEELLHSS